MLTFDTLIGKTIVDIEGGEKDEVIVFKCDDGTSYRLFHERECCESVYVEDICGDLEDIKNSPILVAEETCSRENELSDHVPEESITWTFYKLDTVKGGVVIRWIGESNGYYSESVDFAIIKCGKCVDCLDIYDPLKEKFGPLYSRMVLCPTCGNKRCPKAANHNNQCTNSNDPNQLGSYYHDDRYLN